MIRITALLSLAGVLVAQPIVPSDNGTVWIQPNIMDQARGSVNNLSVAPSAQNGAWVDADKTAGINGNPPSNPTAGNNAGLLVANPAQPGPLVPSGAVQAVKLDDSASGSGAASNASSVKEAASAAGTNETVPSNSSLSSTVPAPSNASIAESAPPNANVSSSGESANNAAAVAVPVAASNASGRADESIPAAAASNSSASGSSDAAVAASNNSEGSSSGAAAAASNSSDTTLHMLAVPVVPVIGPSQPVPSSESASAHVAQAEPVAVAPAAAAANESLPAAAAPVAAAQPAVALVSSEVNNQQNNQSFAIDPTKPIIAILPPGSNFTATWNASALLPSAQPLAIAKREVPAVLVASEQPAVVVGATGSNQSAVLVESSKPVVAVLPTASNPSAAAESAPVAAVAPAVVAPAVPVILPVAVEQHNVSVAEVPVVAQNASAVNTSSAEPEVKAANVPMTAVGANNAIDASAVASNASVSTANATVVNATDVSANHASNAAVLAQAPPIAQADHGVDLPVILPAGAGNITSKEQLAAIPGALPIPIASVPVGSGETKMVQQVPVTNERQPAGDLIQQNHRFELQVVDFELSNAEGQSGDVLVNLTAGALPPVMAETSALLGKDVTPMQANDPKLLAPESTTNYEKVYSGSFAQKASNIDHSVSLDLCGQIPDKGLLQVQIKPSGNGTVTPLQYTCPINLQIRTWTRQSEAEWSEAFPCAGTSGVNTAKLWYKVRQWNINWSQCQQQRPSQALA